MRSLLLLAGVLICTSLFAQTSQIQGTVLDSTGAAVPGADVKATQTGTGAVRNATSAADGTYVLSNLPIGPYRLEVSKQGFTTYVQTGITLLVNTSPTVDVALKVGNVSEQVQVEANAALVETQATGIGSVIENRRILELPLNGRVATDLIVLSGAVIPQGVAGNGGYPGTQQYVINGGQSFGTGFWLDGSVFNNPWDNANMPFPFPDALQEFKVETSALTAQNGVHAGGTITGVTKSGTNAFHGDAFEFLRNGAMNGTNWSTHTNDGLKRNQFGGVIGGPVKKDKIFFFFGYQGTITHQTAFVNDFIPTPAMIAGDFTACPSAVAGNANFVNNQLKPGLTYDPAAVKLAKLLPTASGCGLSPLGLVTQVNEKQYVGRGDYQSSAKNTIFGRYLRSQYFRPPSLTVTPSNILSSSQGGLDDADQTWTAGDTYLFSSTMVNQFRGSVDRLGIRRFDSDFVDSCDLGVQKVYCGYVPHQSTFNIGTAGVNGFSVGPGTGGKADAHSTIFQLNDDVSWVHGSHQINFGMGGSMYKMIFLGNVYAQGLWGFANIPSFLLGQFNTYAMSAPNPLPQQRWFINGYVQDTWKATPRLTVNVGVRWEPSLPPGALNRSAYNFSFANMLAGKTSQVFVNGPPGLTFPGDAGFEGLAGVKRQWNLFAPRVALGYDPTGTGKMTIRASFGISYDYVNGSMYVNSADSPPFGNTSIFGGNKFSDPYSSSPGSNIFPFVLNNNAPFAPGGTYIAEQPDNKATEVYQWNFVVQRQFGNDWVASATYTGSESQNLLGSYQLNPATIVPCAGGAPITSCNSIANQNSRRFFTVNKFPGAGAYGYMDVFDTGGTSSYNGMILAVQKRLSKGLSTSANYTWSHCIGDLTLGNSTGNAGGGYTIPNNRRFDRANCQSVEIGGVFSSDRRQIFNWTTVYETPRFANRTTRLLGSGWKFSGIYRAMSAPWVTIFMSSDVALTGAANTGQRPNTNGGASLCPNPGPTCWINPAAFSAPAPGTFGNVGRDSIQAPAFWQFDMAASRVFTVREGYTLELRGEAFNLSNTRRAGISPPSLAAGASGLNLTYGTPGFGTITSSLDPRIMQLALKFVF